MKLITFLITPVICTVMCSTAFSQTKDTTITAKAFKTFTIKIPSNTTTGFSWELSDSLNARFVKKVAASYQRDPKPPEGTMGAPGFQVFTYKALRKGVTKITLVHGQPWTKPYPAGAEKMSFLVKIK